MVSPMELRTMTGMVWQMRWRSCKDPTRGWPIRTATVGYGLSEYLDQIIDDAPVGIAE